MVYFLLNSLLFCSVSTFGSFEYVPEGVFHEIFIVNSWVWINKNSINHLFIASSLTCVQSKFSRFLQWSRFFMIRVSMTNQYVRQFLVFMFYKVILVPAELNLWWQPWWFISIQGEKKILLPGSDPLSIASQAENIPDYVDVFAFFNISVLMLF